LERVVQFGQLPERHHKATRIGDERRDRAHGSQAAQGEPGADAGDDRQIRIGEDVHERHHGHRESLRPDARIAYRPVRLGERRGGGLLLPVGLNHACAAHGLFHLGVQFAELRLQAPEAVPRAMGNRHRYHEHQRDHRQAGERQPGVQHQHHDEDARHGQDAGDELRDALRQDAVDGVDIVREAAHDVAVRVFVKVAQAEGLQVGEQIPPQDAQRLLSH